MNMRPHRWVGIDEAGYGPNLGPLVMTAVIAEGPDNRPPDLWADLAATVSRAGGPADRLWIDDSKVVMRGKSGRGRLAAATRAAVVAATGQTSDDFAGLLRDLGAGDLATVELDLWDAGSYGEPQMREDRPNPFVGAPWRLAAIRTVVVGPSRFNRELALAGSKAVVHFGAFRELLQDVWTRAADGMPTAIRGDKHGGRNFYAGPLAEALPDGWVTPFEEGAALSRYAVRGEGRTLGISFRPRADADDGLVALASIVSKHVREGWMDRFNAFWASRLPGLKPTAGYPVDAARFREAIAGEAERLDLPPSLWWRER